MRSLILTLTLLVAGCQEAVPREEAGTVVSCHHEEGYSYLTTCTGFDFDGDVTIHLCTETVPDHYYVTFACQHGQFTTGGSARHDLALYLKMQGNIGKPVSIAYQDWHRTDDDDDPNTHGEFLRHDFLDANIVRTSGPGEGSAQ